mmetsp:Transcript_13412/g.37664  ORF Transcript_13412/g.37664 Transcript_13412/m.37664 type:complete len:125 (-) Transcript_13412:1389-1763(-)
MWMPERERERETNGTERNEREVCVVCDRRTRSVRKVRGELRHLGPQPPARQRESKRKRELALVLVLVLGIKQQDVTTLVCVCVCVCVKKYGSRRGREYEWSNSNEGEARGCGALQEGEPFDGQV